VTRPKDAMFIQEEITSSLPHVNVFVDAFASIGGDSMGAIYAHRDAAVYAVQRVRTDEEGARFDRLVHNLRAFTGAVKERSGAVQCVPSDIGTFLREQQALDISVLYLDPPWALGAPDVISPSEDLHKSSGTTSSTTSRGAGTCR